jgi:hypothetical protein
MAILRMKVFHSSPLIVLSVISEKAIIVPSGDQLGEERPYGL